MSDASKETLKFQGGALKEEEAKLFENNVLFKEIVKMRMWDDLAKDDKLNLAANDDIIKQYLEKYKSSLSLLITRNAQTN